MFGLILLAARPVMADGPDGLHAPAGEPMIASGSLVETCAWPTAVSVGGGNQCSGTLVHPRVVAYAAHCGGGPKTIAFGEDRDAPAHTVQASHCRAYGDYAGPDDQGHDWAYCLLDEAITQLPSTPPLFGCETALLEVGREVALVGFGQTIDDSAGLKRWAATNLVAVTPGNNTTLVGNPNVPGTPSICSGDSGGPALIQLDDGSWRTFGIASTVVGDCGGYGAHAMLAGAVAWIEWDSGVDITPCHAADGSWAPSPACDGAYAQPAGLGSGAWTQWCSGAAVVARGRSCGPAWDEFDATLVPSVSIVAPTTGESFLDGILLDIVVAADKHEHGYAIAHVELEVDGMPFALDDNDPWVFVGTSLAGPAVHTLVAIAEDFAGNRVRSEPIEVGIGVEVPETGDETGTSSSSETGPALDDGGDAPGCACRARDRSQPGIGSTILLLLLLLALRFAGSRARETMGRRAGEHELR